MNLMILGKCTASNLAWPLTLTLPSATVEDLMKEYKACESPDYITYVSI
jgi:hypothetical protein